MRERLPIVWFVLSRAVPAMRLRFAIGVRRLLYTPKHAGSWGKIIVCTYLLGWALAVLIDAPATTQWPPIQLYVQAIGRLPFAAVLLVGALAPVLAMASGKLWLRLFTTSYLFGTWFALLISSFAYWNSFRPAAMACFAGVLGAANSMWRIVSEWSDEIDL